MGPNLPRILVVDDEPTAIEETIFALKAAGFDAVGAKDAMSAIEKFIADERIGVVVTDIRMPMQDGVEMVSRIRKCGPRGEDCGIIMVTGYPEFETAIGALEQRVSKYLVKPIDISDLLVAVSQSANRYVDLATARRGQSILVDGLNRLINKSDVAPASADADAGTDSHDVEDRRTRTLESLLRMREIRSEYLPSEILADPAWFMLVDLALVERRGKKISVSALCQTSGVSQTTALRRVQELVELGLVVRSEDPTDRRRVYIHLADDTRKRLMSLIDRLAP